ncbi:hypothetical protein CORC01_07866 [Colletotrichum orchidophilum]|uniref:Uncharacterized protein n=1 Tax=Colletotrichum orchidophilum TaxID=1209926 RepID=A0A1G4B626_9PEZI|nr:uncharacterized protein CORC01_07866 [Colletotrichum orchidophilum]OHE96899.1 hypothetical protein CORC01_07866 [Colletotrichum orchidophilum]
MDKIANMRLSDNRHMLKVHIAQIAVIHIVMGLSGAKLPLKSGPMTCTNTMSLGIACLKANAILDCVEPVFCGAVVLLSFQGNIQRCVGTIALSAG